jgi:hypothetical protein
MVPCGRLALRLLSDGRQVGAQVLAHPVDQPSDLGVGQIARLFCNRLHLVEECLFAAPELLGVGIARRVGLRNGGDSLDLGRLLGLELFRRPLATFVVGIGRRGEEVRVLVARCDNPGIGCPPLRKKVSESIDDLKGWKNKPGASKALDILVKILDKLAGELPPTVEEFVKAYLGALEDSLKTAYGFVVDPIFWTGDSPTPKNNR